VRGITSDSLWTISDRRPSQMPQPAGKGLCAYAKEKERTDRWWEGERKRKKERKSGE